MEQRFIEYDLPVAEISEQSSRESEDKYGQINSLHKWWARRPLVPSRTTALAALVSDPGPHAPDERRKIREVLSKISPYESIKDGESPYIEQARELIREEFSEGSPKVLDPFAGGGAIPLESLRLGLETDSGDYNPVAVLIEKATLEWPSKFGIEVELPKEKDRPDLGMSGPSGNLLIYLVRKWMNELLDAVDDEIGHLYPKQNSTDLVGKREVTEDGGWVPVGYLWARTAPCQNPTCDTEVPLIKRQKLCKTRSGKHVAFRLVVDDGQVGYEILEGEQLEEAIEKGFDPGGGTVERGNASCPVCGQVTKSARLRELSRQGEMGQKLIAIVLHHPDEIGKKYRLASDEDRKVYRQSEEYLGKKLEDWQDPDVSLPEEELPPVGTLGFRVNRYGMTKWKDLFNSRQKLALITLVKKFKEIDDKILSDVKNILEENNISDNFDEGGVHKAVKGYLSLFISKHSAFLSNLTRWKPSSEQNIPVLASRAALKFTWDYFETNPLSGSCGTMESGFPHFESLMERLSDIPRAANVRREDATDIASDSNEYDAVLTDPPYYDNVPYAALSDFFYVWLKRLVGDDFPSLFSTPLVPKTEEAIVDPQRHESDDEAKKFFERKLTKAFSEMHRVLKPGGVAVVVYAHKTTEGWETMLRGLVDAGFAVTGSWPFHSEMKSRLRAAQSAALASSIYMVCRKTEREELGFWNDIQPQIKSRVEEKLQQFWEADVIRGGDFFISAIGPGMEAYSRYDRVETYSGEEITVRDLLQYIRSVATDFLVHRLLRNGSAESVDKEGQFYLTYRWTFRNERVEYDDALRIAKAEGVDLERLADTDTFIKKTRKYIYVHGPQDRNEIDEVHNMVDAAQLACRMWEQGRKEDIGPMLAKHGYSESPSFWQFCQAIAECLPEGNKEKQWLEGMLMGKNKYQEAEAVGGDGEATGQVEIDFDDGES